MKKISTVVYGLLLLALIAAPFVGFYPVFVMKVLCFALFACAFNLLLGYTGLLSFGHAAFLGGSAYVAGHAIKVWQPDARSSASSPGTLHGRAAGLAVRLAGHPPPGHLLRDDHAGAGADDVLRRAAGASSPAARTACRACRAASCSA